MDEQMKDQREGEPNDYYGGNDHAMTLGIEASQKEVGSSIWTAYMNIKENGEFEEWYDEAGDGLSSIPLGDIDALIHDIWVTVPVEEWEAVGVRSEDIELLELLHIDPNQVAILDERSADCLNFLQLVMETVVGLAHEAFTKEGIDDEVRLLRNHVEFALWGDDNADEFKADDGKPTVPVSDEWDGFPADSNQGSSDSSAEEFTA
jgi:hypothetical protein